jgi:uncharacterized membrane-anchored protein
MQTRHVPNIDRRYWVAILFASIFGTNLGDFYAHESGLGLGLGLLVLLGLFLTTWLVETRDRTAHEAYYWLVIIIVRTGATNIADFLAFRVRIPPLVLSIGLTMLIGVFAWSRSAGQSAVILTEVKRAPKPNAGYWIAMLAAGVLGTVVGDVSSHTFGQGASALVLTGLLTLLLGLVRDRAATSLTIYWCVVALARTAGTCIGDWLAENKIVHLGLPLSTLLTGIAFVGILTLWRSSHRAPLVTA